MIFASCSTVIICSKCLGLFQEFGSSYSRSIALLENVQKLERISHISGLGLLKNCSLLEFTVEHLATWLLASGVSSGKQKW